MQVLTFDFHNTLIHCDPWFELEVRTLPRAVARLLNVGAELPDARIDAVYRELRQSAVASGVEVDASNGVERVFRQLEIDASPNSIATAIDLLMREAQNSVQPVDGAVETVKHLDDAGVRLGIVSSAVHHDTLRWSLERVGIADAFRSVVSSASCGSYKSSTAIYRHALADMGGSAAISVHVGDSLKWDVTVAREAGMSTVWLQTPHHEEFSRGLATSAPVLTLQTLRGAGPVLVDLLAEIRSYATRD